MFRFCSKFTLVEEREPNIEEKRNTITATAIKDEENLENKRKKATI